VDFPHSLADDLDALTEALGDPVLDLGAVLGVLTDDLLAVVPSYLGLSITLRVDRIPVTFTFLTAPVDVRASLWLSLVPPESPAQGGNVVFFASTPCAFRSLADDAWWMVALYGQAVLDGHLPPTGLPCGDGLSSLAEFSEINQAIGVLIATGHAAPEARDELGRRANCHQRTLLETARELLGTAAGKKDPAG
jgi:hypothetical protein